MKQNKQVADMAYEEYKKLEEEIIELQLARRCLLQEKWESPEQVQQYTKIRKELEPKERERDRLARIIVKHIYGGKKDE